MFPRFNKTFFAYYPSKGLEVNELIKDQKVQRERERERKRERELDFDKDHVTNSTSPFFMTAFLSGVGLQLQERTTGDIGFCDC